MNKTRFRDGNEGQGTRGLAVAAVQRAERAEKESADLRNRISRFYSVVDYVTFGNEASAPVWVNQWRDWLLNGEVPAACTQDGPYAKSKADLQPVPDPDDDVA